jgi:hypothetical protein
MLLELSYVGSKSFRLDREFDENPLIYDSSHPYGMPTYPQLNSILVQKSDGRAQYDSFQARLSRRFKDGFMFDLSYVFGRSLDNSSGPSYDETVGYNDVAGGTSPYDWARSQFDRRQNLVAFYAYDLPAVRIPGLWGALFNRWQIAGATQLRSGMPMDILGYSGNYRPDIIGPFRRFDPRQVHTFVLDGTAVTGNFLFDPTVFRNPETTSLRLPPGNLGRNVFDRPGVNLTSLSIAKRNRIGDSQLIELRADITNAFNHANFIISETAVYFSQDPAGFLYAFPGRSIQLSLKYKF